MIFPGQCRAEARQPAGAKTLSELQRGKFGGNVRIVLTGVPDKQGS